MSQNDGVVQPLLELDRDRGGRAAGAVDERLGLLAHHLSQLLGVEVGLAVGRGEHASNRSRHGADPGPARRELAPGREQVLEQLLSARGFLLRDVHEGLDGPAGHPVSAMVAVGAKLLDPLPEDGGHVRILAEEGTVAWPPHNGTRWNACSFSEQARLSSACSPPPARGVSS